MISTKTKTVFVPSHTKLLNKDKKPCTSDERPEIIADYYENEQWAINENRDKETPKTRVPPHLDLPNINESEFSIEELDIIIRKLKNKKSPGPDGKPTEFFKFLDGDARLLVLDILNDCWRTEIMPSELELAELVTLYKKGNVENPANYRPIALLNTLYKLYASLLQRRISIGL